ncbi:hypothetical protein [Saccharopolyspora pogona]|uniref:hypothetical protein n=1 Tax=Saccharopolyspora pogona TaxID=333966 RepID=UPI0016855F77|nr:hypothetical protein [Saccharopolyspora pogona]
MMSSSAPIVPATPQVSGVKPIEWPPKGMRPVQLSEPQLVAEGERMRGYLAEAVPEVDTGAYNVTTTQPHGLGPGFGAEPPATVVVRADFKNVLASSGKSVELPMRLTVVVQGPGTVAVQPAQACGDGDDPAEAVLSCSPRTLDDGTIVVESVTGLASRGGDGPKTHIVRHFRACGTVVSATASHAAGQEASGLGAYRQVHIDRLDRIATDPELALKS